MLRVVLDTNIYVSGVFWRGSSNQILERAADGDICVFVSTEIIEELKRVLKRDFELKENDIEEIENTILSIAKMVKSSEKVDLVEEDPDDNKIIECAIASNSDYIITKDKHLLRIKQFRNIRILSPDEFK
ncbi:putative toxin-antitoxin system toxin component, PIN family [Candidatus Woesearchaeota archaeon]|nr:putative toxin-antitoxin system toxin component, PIN family [Candidatus Woesearchaeota archaeon]